jgi:hypothetical protein
LEETKYSSERDESTNVVGWVVFWLIVLALIVSSVVLYESGTGKTITEVYTCNYFPGNGLSYSYTRDMTVEEAKQHCNEQISMFEEAVAEHKRIKREWCELQDKTQMDYSEYSDCFSDL